MSMTGEQLTPAKHVLSNVEGTQRRQVRKLFFLPLRLCAFAGDIPSSFFAFFAAKSVLNNQAA